MTVPEETNAVLNAYEDASGRETHYSKLFRKFVVMTMICSLAPLLLVGWGINIRYTRFAESRAIESFETQLAHHCTIIEQFVKELTSKMRVISKTHSLDQLADPARLDKIFEVLNNGDNSFTDLGIIDENGKHLAYVGPFDLIDKNYAEAFWFKEVMAKGTFISDMFMGFRKEPHFIIAVVREEAGRKWILRATVDTDVFRSLVESVRVGKTGEVLMVNREGIFQTQPRFSGRIMEKAPFGVGSPNRKIQVDILKDALDAEDRHIPRQIAVWTWLADPQWMLMIRQDYKEALDSVNHANFVTLIGLHIGALIILVVTVLVTRYMITVIRRRDLEADHLNKQYMQASKLASIGELSAGVAHEINNPLAIILTERQILLDTEKQTDGLEPEFKKQLDDSLTQIDIQIQRCKRITHNLLRFSRRTTSVMESLDLNEFIREVVDLMEREARANGIKFVTDLNPDLPLMVSDASQLQQVFLNLITNAIDAHNEKPYGRIDLKTSLSGDGRQVHLVVGDTGSGIPDECLKKVFDPFFTTKPVGKGTGLGLSICYTIIQRLGGKISVESRNGEGTRFDIVLPLQPPAELVRDLS